MTWPPGNGRIPSTRRSIRISGRSRSPDILPQEQETGLIFGVELPVGLRPLFSSTPKTHSHLDCRAASASIYGAICPAEGKGAALVLPHCNTEGMTLHLAEIAATVAPGAHAVLLLDQAGTSRRASSFPATPPCCRCRPNAPSSIRSRTSGSSCATTGCRTASSNPATTSSTSAASPGTASPISRGVSCPSDCGRGRMGSDQRVLVPRTVQISRATFPDQRRRFIALFSHKGFQDLAHVIYRTAQIMTLAVDSDEHLVDVPAPVTTPPASDPSAGAGCQPQAD